MMAAMQSLSLIARLPAVRGRLSENADLSKNTWFRVGGPAEVLFKPADAEDLAAFLRGCPGDVAVTVIGVGSNILVRDGGVPGVVVRLGRGFVDIDVHGEEITVGAGALDASVALTALKEGLGGFEFLSGIPGAVGGALRMNAGAYGADMKAVVIAADAVDRTGTVHRLSGDDLGFGYRHCAVPEDWIFTRAHMRGRRTARRDIQAAMDAIRSAREDAQPLRTPTGGSTFRNPEGYKAWELIDRAGCRGLKRGGAMVSEKHCNFLINMGDATARDLEMLGEEVRARVLKICGVRLQWEIRRIGVDPHGAGDAPQPREATP
ncbi:UDP-N-acetylmuramate dehydrogenase [Varunaivibrio sulfuroxidans]|uniref:UDP-N-acetylenolpyruvoylglucosamine reductase n=1 Tax=Varunaivibrio sulfuroxidans TaxID=1773489 RepID=A0A4R3JAV0_9PROT|nr:UDP-N-acetylmuramate dehydrogenase [Varunaivibrio sulfuroxidans]TCS62196.1 UDP-N-acetylmuramate dehydrogenase [Varunaivibrio sulfuroxidans]WES30623.1 UDP-N-acetylmuramate dehydrogenase [Varunaivibrio sulfuroxidans]